MVICLLVGVAVLDLRCPRLGAYGLVGGGGAG